MSPEIWSFIASLGLHVGPLVVEFDRIIRAELPLDEPFRALVDAYFLSHVEKLRSEGRSCFPAADMNMIYSTVYWDLHEATTGRCLHPGPVFTAPCNEVLIGIYAIRERRIATQKLFLRLASMRDISRGAALAEIEMQTSDHLIAPANHDTVFARLIERFGFCRDCAEYASREVL